MSVTTRARSADTRALAHAAVLGSIVAAAIGGAYWAGGLARAAVVHAEVSRLAGSGLQSPMSSQIADAQVANRGEARLIAAIDTPSAAASETTGVARMIRTAYAAPPAPPPSLRAVIGEGSRDLECLGQAIYYEARGETTEGQAAVAQVVLNRVRHKSYPKSVCGVVFQHSGASCQFSFACHVAGKPPVESAAWRRSRDMAARMLAGEVLAAVGDATAFHAGRSEVAGMLKVAQIGAHAFYRFAGRQGAPAMFRSLPQPSAGGETGAGKLLASTAAPVDHAGSPIETVAPKVKHAALAGSDDALVQPTSGSPADKGDAAIKIAASQI